MNDITKVYLTATGWPVTLKGQPKKIDDLTMSELREVAKKYVAIYVREAAEITTRKAELQAK